jgi:hypothetical protein
MAKKRAIIEVVPFGRGDWRLMINGASVDAGTTKKNVIAWARSLANYRLDAFDEKSQVRVRKTDGTYQTEWTYPDDTPKRKG